jgi:hypothetical protein
MAVDVSGREDEVERRTAPFHFQRITHPGACRKAPVVAQNRRPSPEPTEMERLT